jgi:hypothetical protein
MIVFWRDSATFPLWDKKAKCWAPLETIHCPTLRPMPPRPPASTYIAFLSNILGLWLEFYRNDIGGERYQNDFAYPVRFGVFAGLLQSCCNSRPQLAWPRGFCPRLTAESCLISTDGRAKASIASSREARRLLSSPIGHSQNSLDKIQIMIADLTSSHGMTVS